MVIRLLNKEMITLGFPLALHGIETFSNSLTDKIVPLLRESSSNFGGTEKRKKKGRKRDNVKKIMRNNVNKTSS